MIRTILALLTTVALLSAGSQAMAAAPSVVYHINDAAGQALSGLRNARNQLDVAPETKMVIVTHANGIDFLMTGYKDADKVGPLVSALAARGVEFEVCEITLKNRNLSKDEFMLEANFVPSGVVRITQLQQDGYAYLKP